MKYLLDVNILLAWGWIDHSDHVRTAKWIASTVQVRGTKLLTSSIPELGFVRVSVQRSGGRVSVQDAVTVLGGMLSKLKNRHEFLPDDLSSTSNLPLWCRTAGGTTDAHLLQLAKSHGAELATLDAGIPGSILI